MSWLIARVVVRVDVRNTGKVRGAEVVQLYVTDRYSTITTPVRVLRGFEKTTLRPGQVKTVQFTLGPDDLNMMDEHGERVVEPGDFDIRVGRLTRKLTVKGT